MKKKETELGDRLRIIFRQMPSTIDNLRDGFGQVQNRPPCSCQARRKSRETDEQNNKTKQKTIGRTPDPLLAVLNERDDRASRRRRTMFGQLHALTLPQVVKVWERSSSCISHDQETSSL
ncbi:hypothetical protein GWI33_015298 [Rhynchophorus ferrugineus]|uniref:Uncharacterized protein n=1 Tax=Rhynchophorus ferrugineus TaxID=354439 RepID=A0A834I2U9_RHYFE|nr:hypothetical protein GWI33_015298 [Rhynchophorus ferrugineus]